MTNLEALRAMIEFGYTNDNLFTKVLEDNSITGSDTYTAANQGSIDIALADVCLAISTHPEFKDGKSAVKWSKSALLELRKTLYQKNGIALPEDLNKKANIDGRAIM